MNYLGIDPGVTGAMALVSESGKLLAVDDWPGDMVEASHVVTRWGIEWGIDMAAVELVAARPGQGVSSTFKFGVNYGGWLGILAAMHIPTETPRPQEWQKRLVRPSDGADPKARTLTVARRLYPADAEVLLKRKKDHNRADAILIARSLRDRHAAQEREAA